MKPNGSILIKGDRIAAIVGPGPTPLTTGAEVIDATGKLRYIDAETLEAAVPARLLSRVGTFPVIVWNPPPDGGTSQIRYFIVKFR